MGLLKYQNHDRPISTMSGGVFFLATFKIQHCDTCSRCLCFHFYFVKINVSNMQVRENLNSDVLSEIILYFILSYTGFSHLKSSVYI